MSEGGSPGPRHASVIKSVPGPVPDDFIWHWTEQSKENTWRRWAITLLLAAFVVLNGTVLAFLYVVWLGETGAGHPGQIVTERVMLALIGGSVAQLGAIALAIGAALARRP